MTQMREFVFWLAVAAALVVFCLFTGLDAKAQTTNAQEQVERTIGSLVVNNAQCNAHSAALAAELDKTRKELEALKAGKK